MVSPERGAENRPSIRDLKWSAAEKKIARQAFERALQREFRTVIDETHYGCRALGGSERGYGRFSRYGKILSRGFTLSFGRKLLA